jgi:hypothetical protein
MIDLIAVGTANLFNVLIVGIMLARPKGWVRLEFSLGIASIALILPLGFVAGYNLWAARDFWLAALPSIMIVYLLVEGLLDYILKLPFRQTRWLGAYLLLFYLAQWGMIGYVFIARPVYGFITLLTYFLGLGATAYSYARVGHGDRTNPGV